MIVIKELKTNQNEEIIDITRIIQEEIIKNNYDSGNITVFVPHTTAGIAINENADPDVKTDILTGLNLLNFDSKKFKHSEGNSPAHLKAFISGNTINLIVNKGKLILGRWQGIYFCEFDGPRSREFIISL